MLEFIQLLVDWIKVIGSLAPEALVKALVVLISVFALRALSVIPTSNWARAANTVFSVLLSGMTAGAEGNEVLVYAMTSAFSAALWEGLVYIYTKYFKQVKPFTKKK